MKEKSKSKSIAAIVGPTLVVMILSEMKFWNPELYASQIVPLIYLNGVLLFVAGISIVKSHNVWTTNWPVLLTILGYALILIGLFRMFFPNIQEAEFENNNVVMIIQIALIAFGVFLTLKAYYPTKNYS